MLKLEGWSLTTSTTTAFDASKNGERVSIAVRPSLRAVEADPPGWDNAVVLSEYEIRKDLPSCLMKMP